MKKTYFSPETEVVILNLNQSLLAGSIQGEVDPGDGPTPSTDDPLPGDDDGSWGN